MPSLDDWLAALTTPKRISVDASKRLMNDVNALPASRSFMGQPKKAQAPAIIPPRTVTLTASELLLALGKITTPRVQNIVDLSNLWAYFRYTWAFDPSLGFGNMRLSQDAWDIDFHQKTIMSDDMGVGFTAYLMEAYYDAPTSMDVDVALRNQNEIPGLRKQYRTLPDYLFRDRRGNYYVVECKGTRQSRKPMLGQLRRGLEQVPSLVFPTGQQPVCLVVGARLSKRTIEVYIVDPPTEKDESMGGKDHKSKNVYDIKDVKLFEKDVEDLRRANLFLFAGVTDKAIKAFPHREEKEKFRRGPLVHEPQRTIRSAEIEQDFVGASQSIKLSYGSEKVTVFQGISARVYHNIDNGDIDSAETAGFGTYQKAQEVSREMKKNNTSGAVISEMANHSLKVDVFSKDGSMLRIEVDE